MLDPLKTYCALRSCGVDFFTGIPDSLLKDFCACITELSDEREHIIAANEGGSIALATGHHLATGKCPLVYLQNSGLGNTVNPLLSLADKAVYSVPMLLMIGWRGQPGVKDEPQHVRQGEVTLQMLEGMGVTTLVLPSDEEQALRLIEKGYAEAVKKSQPVALLVPKALFAPFVTKKIENSKIESDFLREQALEIITTWASRQSAIVATTGKTSRELFELREKNEVDRHKQDFLSVGSMGHCSQIALGIALSQSEREVICIDGDGAALMHMGGMALIGQSGARNFIHIIINNGAHESVGAQPTVALNLDLPMLGKSLGYGVAFSCSDAENLKSLLPRLDQRSGPVLLEVQVVTGSREDLGRPTLTPLENKRAFMDHLQEN